MRENHSVLERPGEWLKGEGKTIDNDIEINLDWFAGLCQESPKGALVIGQACTTTPHCRGGSAVQETQSHCQTIHCRC